MSKLADLRKILETLHQIGHWLTEEELGEIAKVLYKAIDRLIAEGEGN